MLPSKLSCWRLGREERVGWWLTSFFWNPTYPTLPDTTDLKNILLFLSVSVRTCRFFLVLFCPYLSVFVRLLVFVPFCNFFVNLGPFISVSVNFCPFLSFISVSGCFFQFLSVSLGFCPFLSSFDRFLSNSLCFCPFLSVSG